MRRRTAELEAALRENEKIQRALRESEAIFRAVVSQSMVGIVLVENGKFSYSNPKFDEMMGYDSAEIRRLAPLDLVVDGARPAVAEGMSALLSGEVERFDRVFRAARKDGEVINAEIHASLMSSDGRQVLVALVLDVTERTRAERELAALRSRLEEQSTHDALTGLYNRHYLEATLDQALTVAASGGMPVSVIMCDLDHFKRVNDLHGHLAGDAVLRAFAALVKRHARSGDIDCRYGGEEFLMILPGMALSIAAQRAEQLRVAVATATVRYATTAIAMTASFGVASFPCNGATGDALIAAADRAMYAAKAAGRNRVNLVEGPAPLVAAATEAGA